MSEDPWGVDVPPAVPAELPPLPADLAELAELAARGGRRFLEGGEDFVRPRAADLPEVQALTAEGWHPAPDDPMSCCLPAVWPAEHRCWVPGRLPRICSVSSGGRSWLEPLDEDDAVAIEADVAVAARDCGLPPPPPGRLWLLRSPWPTLGLEVVLALIRRRRAERVLEEGATGTTAAAADLLARDEEEVWAWWRGPAAEAALGWPRHRSWRGLTRSTSSPKARSSRSGPGGRSACPRTPRETTPWCWRP